MHRLRLSAIAILVVAAGAAAQEPGKLPEIVGKITLDGRPLREAKLGLHPEKGKAVFAKVLQDGTFTLKAAAGRYRVTVEGKPCPANTATLKQAP